MTLESNTRMVHVIVHFKRVRACVFNEGMYVWMSQAKDLKGLDQEIQQCMDKKAQLEVTAWCVYEQGGMESSLKDITRCGVLSISEWCGWRMRPSPCSVCVQATSLLACV